MSCRAPAFMRAPNCPGPKGLPAVNRCKRCARGACEAPDNTFDANCEGPDAALGSFICQACQLKRTMKARRGSISGMGGARGQYLQKEWSQRVALVVQDLFDEQIGLSPPCRYAVCLAGSGARREASPYSDLDCFLLVEDDSPPKVATFKGHCQAVKDLLLSAEGNGGLRFCNIMSPLGDPGNAKAPTLIRTPRNMAALLEWDEAVIEGHVVQGLQEHDLLFGYAPLYADFKTEMGLILGKNCYSFSSRPILTRLKKQGLQIIKEVVNNPNFKMPARTDQDYQVKEQFYRPVQFLAKGLAYYYAVSAVSTAEQLDSLVQGNHMSRTVANNFSTVMNAMARLRFKLHLDREGEKDFVYTDQGARDTELLDTTISTERRNRLKAGTLLTTAEVKELRDAIPSLAYILRKGREFVAQKEKIIGKRKNPFAEG